MQGLISVLASERIGVYEMPMFAPNPEHDGARVTKSETKLSGLREMEPLCLRVSSQLAGR
jgi:hypothetical protein